MEEEEVEVPVVKEPAKEGNKMDTDEASSDAAPTTESDVNMQDAKGGTGVPGAENGAPDSGDKPVQMETDAKVSSSLVDLRGFDEPYWHADTYGNCCSLIFYSL